MCHAARLFMSPCQVITVLAAQLIKSLYLPPHSYVMCQRWKAPCPFPPQPSLPPSLPLALCSSGCFIKLSLAQDPISRTLKAERREPNSSGRKREQREIACHTEEKQTQISVVYLRSPRLIFTVVLGAVVISLTGVRGRPLHFPWNLCLVKHWKLQRRRDDIWAQ